MDSVESASRAFTAGDFSGAVRHGWRAATSAARVQDESTLASLAALADRTAAALRSDPGAPGAREAQAADADRLADYCRACLIAPRDPAASFWGLGRFFQRSQSRKPCPDCAESIALRAKVCRFCGYRYPEASDEG